MDNESPSLNCGLTQDSELVYRCLSPETSIAGSLYGCKWHLGFIVNGWPIDMADPAFDSECQFPGAPDVLAEDRRRQTITGVVRNENRLVLTLHANDRYATPPFSIIRLWKRKLTQYRELFPVARSS